MVPGRVPSCGAAEQLRRWTRRTAYDLSNSGKLCAAIYTPAIVPRRGGTCFCRCVARGSKPLPSQTGGSIARPTHGRSVAETSDNSIANAPNVAAHWLGSPGRSHCIVGSRRRADSGRVVFQSSDQSRNQRLPGARQGIEDDKIGVGFGELVNLSIVLLNGLMERAEQTHRSARGRTAGSDYG